MKWVHRADVTYLLSAESYDRYCHRSEAIIGDRVGFGFLGQSHGRAGQPLLIVRWTELFPGAHLTIQ